MASRVDVLQNAQTAAANGKVVPLIGDHGILNAEIQETNGGTATATVTFEGSFDGVTWYAAGYQPINSATLTRSVTGVSVTASAKAAYQILDFYPQIRARVSSPANSATVTVKLYSGA
jgi:hypothetical protein